MMECAQERHLLYSGLARGPTPKHHVCWPGVELLTDYSTALHFASSVGQGLTSKHHVCWPGVELDHVLFHCPEGVTICTLCSCHYPRSHL